MTNKHIIHKLIFEVDGFENNSQYQKFANKISSISRTGFQSRVNQLLDKYSINGYHIVIHSLEIDLEYINFHNIENNILSSLEKLLNRKLGQIHKEALYNIKHGEISTVFAISKNEIDFQNLLQQKEESLPVNIQISKDVKNYFTALSHNKVIPENARYVEAVLYYLEFGWLPKHLEIPYEEFDVKFADTVDEYKEEIIKHFGRKSISEKEKIYKRVFSQISIPKLQEKHLNKSVSKKSLFKGMVQDKIQMMINYLEKQKAKTTTLTEKEKAKTREVIAEIYDYGRSISEVEKIKKLLKPVEQDTEEITQKKPFKHIDTFRESARTKFLKRIDEILYSDDKAKFDSLLESPFYKSIVTSYVSTSDSSELLARSLVPIILRPKKKEQIYQQLPEHIDDEREILNQLFHKSPAILPAVIKRIQKLEPNKEKLKQSIVTFLQSLLKKHINYIFRSTVSNYQKYSPILNDANYKIANSELSKNAFFIPFSSKIDDHKYFQINILAESIVKNESLETVIKKVIEKIIELRISDKFTQSAIEEKLNYIKQRKYSDSEALYEVAMDNLIKDFITEHNPKEIINNQFNTLFQEYYLPAKGKNIMPPTTSKFILTLEKYTKTNDKDKLLRTIDTSDILRNIILRKLSTSDFDKLVKTVLPTSKARQFLSLLSKYEFLWKNMIDIQQVQLIFLSLIQKRKEVNEYSIFRLYFDELKKYKGWTADVLKKRIIDNYEIHSDKLTEEERSAVIHYIDNIPTMQSLSFKDTKKKLEDGIPVKNAGLVLIWPFMKTLFNIADFLTPKGDFKNAALRERAVLMLQYVAVKSTKIEEPYLALNKIMVGMPLDDSLPSEITLTDKEKDIADALLLNVIKQWPSFQNSSVDNLRGSFLIRDGILAFRGNQWVLRVEAKAYDLLLNKLPWGYSMIRLSWLPYMIKVEWN